MTIYLFGIMIDNRISSTTVVVVQSSLVQTSDSLVILSSCIIEALLLFNLLKLHCLILNQHGVTP